MEGKQQKRHLKTCIDLSSANKQKEITTNNKIIKTRTKSDERDSASNTEFLGRNF